MPGLDPVKKWLMNSTSALALSFNWLWQKRQAARAQFMKEQIEQAARALTP